MNFSKEQILSILEKVHDPEIPVLNVVEMGIVRNVELSGDAVRVDITPTYSGCPAMKMIEDDIAWALKDAGLMNVEVRTVHSPAWTTSWMSDETKVKLRDYGIAPPIAMKGNVVASPPLSSAIIPCPYCESGNTELRSTFGSTACKSYYFCKNCMQPFEHFKAI